MSERENKRVIEKNTSSAEQLAEISEKQREVLRSKLDEAEKQHHERQSEQEVLAEATELAEDSKELKHNTAQASPAERRRGAPSKKQLNSSFKTQMQNVQADLGPGSRLISKLIHIRPIEKVSDVVGSTIARPNAMLYGSILAFVSITILYFVARYYGYKLSGFETIAAFCIGWLLGILYDYLSTLFRSRRSH
jgi:hypothetical protein